MLEGAYYGPEPSSMNLNLPTGLRGHRRATRGRTANEKGRNISGPFREIFLLLRVEDAQLERLADRLRAVHHVQLAQDLLHVVLHRERADLQDGADLEVRLAEVDPLQDVQLAHREDALPGELVAAAAVGAARLQLRAHQRGVQRRRHELREVGLARAGGSRPAGEDEQAERAAVGVMHAVHEELR